MPVAPRAKHANCNFSKGSVALANACLDFLCISRLVLCVHAMVSGYCLLLRVEMSTLKKIKQQIIYPFRIFKIPKLNTISLLALMRSIIRNLTPECKFTNRNDPWQWTYRSSSRKHGWNRNLNSRRRSREQSRYLFTDPGHRGYREELVFCSLSHFSVPDLLLFLTVNMLS